MTPLVIDASATMSWCFIDEATPESQTILNTLRQSYAEVPSVWLLEIQNVLLINERRMRITSQGSAEFR